MLALARQPQVLLPQIVAYDEEISCLFLRHADSTVFASLPRAGRRLAPRLLAEWGDDRERYTAVASIRALAGTTPSWEPGCQLRCSNPHLTLDLLHKWQS